MAQPPQRPRRSPTQERSLRTVEVIVEATARVLVEQGYERTTTNRVAKVAGVSVGSLYQYYPNKEALVGAVLEREMSRVTAVILEALTAQASAPLPVLVRALVDALLASHRENMALRRVMMQEVPRLGLLGDFEDNLERLQRIFIALLEQRGDRVRPADVELATFVLVHALAGATRAAIHRRPAHLGHADLAAEITALVCRYLEP